VRQRTGVRDHGLSRRDARRDRGERRALRERRRPPPSARGGDGRGVRLRARRRGRTARGRTTARRDSQCARRRAHASQLVDIRARGRHNRARAGRSGTAVREVFEFKFDGQMRPLLAPLGITPGAARVILLEDRVVARFGPWVVRTPYTNVREVCVTGPYRWYTA